MSIRARLSIGVIVVVTAGIALVGVVAVREARASMVSQIDDALAEHVARLEDEAARRLPGDLQSRRDGPDRGPGPGPPPGGLAPRVLPSDEAAGDGAAGDPATDGNDASAEDAAALEEATDGDYRPFGDLYVRADGFVVGRSPGGYRDDPDPMPTADALDADNLESLAGTITTVAGADGDGDVRMLVQELPGGYLVTTRSLDDVAATTSRLLTVVLVAGLAAIALGGAGSWLLVRRGLRPVDDMIATAGVIASGDLSRRVDHPDGRTELGRLGAALDDMLAQLEEAFAVRRASEERLKRFAADASHELRTPLTAIRGYAELYRNGGVPAGEGVDRVMDRIEGESTRMSRLVDDLLLLARLDQSQPLAREPVDLAAVAREAADAAAVIDPERSVSVAAPEVATVLGDRHRLRQVVDNLLANARVHTPPGTKVRVEVAHEEDGVGLSVADDGPGIPPEAQERVFERFFRVDPSRNRATGGSGLGLAIVAAIVEAHGGSVSLEATLGRGTRFGVRLPAPGPGPTPADPSSSPVVT